MARKVLKQNHSVEGLGAPRNSLELPVETSYNAVGDYIPSSYEVRNEWPENMYSTEVSMKKLINEEISKRPKTKRNAPSIVARLMGMDTLPLDTKSISPQPEKRNDIQEKEQNKRRIGSRSHHKSYSLGHGEYDSFYRNDDTGFFNGQIDIKSKKPTPREHPQEEELKKFKKEFEAWQAARFKECSKVAELGTIPGQLLAQETPNKEKVALYGNLNRVNGQALKEQIREAGGLKRHTYIKKHLSTEKKEAQYLHKKAPSRDFDQLYMVDSGLKLDRSSLPTKIVVLRPGPERISDNEDSQASSSGISDERGNLEDFLEEVKERLKCELQGKTKGESMVRGAGIETRYNKKLSDPKQIAQRIAKQVRESVTRDLGMKLLRSESTRSSRSVMQYDEPGSPEFINRDSRRFLAERLRNVIKGETNQHIPKASYGRLNTSFVCSEKEIEEEEEADMQTRSFRCGLDNGKVHHRVSSPSNLVRSLSAPVSGASFGKLLLEDRHVLTGAHIRRKHEANTESVGVDSKKRKKQKSKFKDRVSSIKYSFTLKGRLFGRKIPSPEQYDYMRDLRSGPTVMMNYTDRHENCTEVPPSPASVCSNVHDELWRDHFSSSSISDLSPLEDSTQIFRDISSNLSELRRQLSELDANGIKEATTEEQSLIAEMKLEDDSHAYIRDLIVASGLHKTSSDKVLSRWDPLAKPISGQIYEEVEESYKNVAKDNEVSTGDKCVKKADHKLLYGLLNEALLEILAPPMTRSRFRKKAIGPTEPPHGRKLLDCVWEIVSGHLYPPMDKSLLSLDDMVASDLNSTPWRGLISDEIDALGKEIEYQIIEHLVDETVKDINSY